MDNFLPISGRFYDTNVIEIRESGAGMPGGRDQRPGSRVFSIGTGGYMKWTKIENLALSLAFPVLVCGCFVTASQGKAMQKQINHLNEQIKVAKGYHEILMQAQEDVKELQEIIERATKNLGENTADFAIQIDKLRTDLAQMEGKVAELSFKLDSVEQEVKSNKADIAAKFDSVQKTYGSDMPIEPSKIPADRDKHWQKANEAFDSKDYETARNLFREYQKRYPDDGKSDDAQLMVGVAYLEEKRGAKALGELQKVIDKYPDSDRMDAVLYYMGEAFFIIQNCADARTLFKSVISQFPKSPFKKKAKDKIQAILKAPKNVCPTIK